MLEEEEEQEEDRYKQQRCPLSNEEAQGMEDIHKEEFEEECRDEEDD